MYGIIGLLNPSFAKRMEEQKLAQEKRRLESAEFVPWDPKIKWAEQLNIQAKTYKPYRLFKVKPCRSMARPNHALAGTFSDSPTGQWRYMHSRLKKGQTLQTWYGSRLGDVMFDNDIFVPVVFEKDGSGKSFKTHNGPWMGLTPAEIISLRGGTRRAKGRVVIAGLGLGYQLLDVAARKQVEEIILVEKSQELVDWILPILQPKIDKPLEVIVGDAYEEMPKLTADVGLVDIFSSYGCNDWERNKLRGSCPNIKYIWCWGAAVIHGGLW